MADNVNKLTQDLEQTTQAVEILKARIEELTQALENYITTSQKSGGIATPTGITTSTQRAVEDPDKWSGRAGGGSRIRGKEDVQNVKDQAREIGNLNKKLGERITLQSRLTNELKELQSTPTQLQLDTSSIEEKLAKVSQRVRMAKAEIRDLTRLGIEPEKRETQLSALQELEDQERKLTAELTNQGEAQRALTEAKEADKATIADAEKEIGTTKEQTDAFKEQTQAVKELKDEKTRPTVESVEADPRKLVAKGFTPKTEDKLFKEDVGLQDLFKKNQAAANNLQVALDKLNKEIGQYGDEVTSQQSKGELLTNGLRKYTTVITTAEGQTRKFTQFLNTSNVALNQTQIEAEEAAMAAKKLATAFKEVNEASTTRYGLAAKAAGKAGYKEEDLKSIYTQHPAGVTFFKYEMKDAMGVTQKYEVVLDKFGKELTRTNRRLLGFAESVKKNTIELIKWSVGVTLVYGTYYKFQQLLETAIDNQTKLATVAVTLGNAQRDLNDIFDDASKVALETGESINAILETYTFAYRAVGAIADPMLRTVKANQLLTDATILNKLSSLDAASSIDVLAGSLRQLQKPTESVADAFSYGEKLLDKWVVTTRNANVDLASLSMAFSVTAESAINAGMSVEELNAVIASLAEKIGGLGGKETGNAVRALIGGVYQQQATTILAKYGIAVKDTTGQMRDFLEISRDIYELYDQKIISATELNKIGLVLGGGVRRGQQYVAYLSDFGNVLELVDKQSTSAGASQQALGIIMETLQVTLTRLSNSIQNLAQTMGTEGGLLGASNAVLGVLTKMVDTTESLVSLFGKLALPAAILGIGAGYFKMGGPIGAAKRADFAGKVGGATQGMMGGAMGMLPFFSKPRVRAGDTLLPVVDPLSNKTQYLLSTPSGQLYMPGMVEGKKPLSQTIPQKAGAFMQQNYWGMMPGAFAAISRAGEGDKMGAGITMAATIGGALAAGPWGALLGTIIAEMFVNKVIEAKADLTDVLVSPLIEYDKTKDEEIDLTDLEARREENTKAIIAAVGYPIESQIMAVLFNYEAMIRQAFGQEGAPIYEPSAPIGRERIGYIEPGLKGDEWSYLVLEAEERAYDAAKKSGKAISDATEARHQEVQVLLEEAKLLSSRSLDPISAEKSTFTKEMKDLNERFGDYLGDLSLEFQEQLRTQVTKGEIPTKKFQTGLETAQGSRANVLAIQAAMTVASEIAGKNMEATSESTERFFDLITKAAPDVVTTLTQMTTKIVDLSAGLDALEGQEVTATVNIDGLEFTKEQIEKQIVDTLESVVVYAKFAEDALEDMAMAKIPQPQMLMTGFEGRSLEDMERIAREARGFQDEQLRDIYQADPTDEMDIEWYQWKTKQASEAEPVFIYLGEMMGYYMAEGLLSTDYLSKALESLQMPELDFGYQFFDVTQQQMQSVMPQYEAIRGSIQAAGGKTEESALLAFFSNSSSPVYMQKDWSIIQFLLGALLKTEQNALKTNRDQLKAAEKQLEGIYNLPGGASFYVPFDAYSMKYKEEGAGGVADLTIPVQDFQSAVNQFEAALIPLSELGRNYEYPGAYETFATREDALVWAEQFRSTPEAGQYNVEAIQSLMGISVMEEPIDTFITNAKEILLPFGGENPLAKIGEIIESIREWFAGEADQTPEDGGIETSIDVPGLVTGMQSSISPLTSSLDNLVTQLVIQNKQGIGGTEFDLAESLSGGSIALSDVSFAVPDVSTKLAMNVNIQTTLNIDGQQVWDAIKDYARTDLVNYGGVAGSASANYTFA